MAALVACTSNSFESTIGNEIKQQMSDPAAYKYVAQDTLRQVTYGEQLDHRLKHFEGTAAINEALGRENKAATMVTRLQAMKQELADSMNLVAATLLAHHCTAKNDAGETVDTIYYVWVDEDSQILKITTSDAEKDECPKDLGSYTNVFRQVLMQ